MAQVVLPMQRMQSPFDDEDVPGIATLQYRSRERPSRSVCKGALQNGFAGIDLRSCALISHRTRILLPAKPFCSAYPIELGSRDPCS